MSALFSTFLSYMLVGVPLGFLETWNSKLFWTVTIALTAVVVVLSIALGQFGVGSTDPIQWIVELIGLLVGWGIGGSIYKNEVQA